MKYQYVVCVVGIAMMALLVGCSAGISVGQKDNNFEYASAQVPAVAQSQQPSEHGVL